jgi:hypothetical protein
MEYGLRIATLDNACAQSVDSQSAALRKRYPDAKLSSLYFGTEFCQELIPHSDEVEIICAHCAAHDLEAVLLTPLVTHKGLDRLDRLFETLAKHDCRPSVVFNDWGVFELLQTTYPEFPRRLGRLMNRGLRDPRLEMQAEGSAGENLEKGAGIRRLAASLGVTAVETDADLEPGFLGSGSEGLNRTLHVPFTFVSSGRNCLEKAAATPAGKGVFTRGLHSGCSAPCRGVCRPEIRHDTQKQMWRAGNTLFFVAPEDWLSRHTRLADRVVFHSQPMP